MSNDFSQPQRQSLIGVLVMFADTLQGAIRALWPVLIIWIFRIDVSKLYLALGAGITLLIVAVVAYLKYLNFTFFLDEDNEEFVISKGVFNKSRIAIPLDKVQQVNISQSLIQRIIGVHALEVDTAGSSKKEVSIRAITHDSALALKKRLLEGKTKETIAGIEEPATQETQAKEYPFIQISLASLFKTGITSNYTRSLAILFAFVVTMYENVNDYLKATQDEEGWLYNYLFSGATLRSVMAVILFFMVVTFVFNLARTIIKYFGFSITKQPNSLLLSYGLLTTRNTILRPEKVQIVSVGRNYFQKKMDIQDLKIRQASDMEVNEQGKDKSAMEIPGCNSGEKDALLEFLLDKVPERGIMLRPNIRKILMQVVVAVVLPLSLFSVYAFIVTLESGTYGFAAFFIDSIPLMVVYILLAAIFIFFSFRNNRLFVSNDFIIKQSGAWDVTNDFLPPHKIQCISVSQYFWHKKTDIGIVKLHTAGGSLSFGLADYTKLKEFANCWLYQVETTDKHWM